ncbi:MAG: GreA/GreB family elongation factor [Firmicutes bacterium]|nr:GreA/GreB family elongation factor [Bacillota bacterium]
MSEVASSGALFENLVKQLVELEEGRSKILQQYFPAGQTSERHEFETLIENYIKEVEQFINENKDNRADCNEVPFVTIGSEVEIEDLEEHESFKYRIISPDQGKFSAEDISCLSPVGKSLLLKKVGDIIEVKAPGGVFSYRIKSVKMCDEVMN